MGWAIARAFKMSAALAVLLLDFLQGGGDATMTSAILFVILVILSFLTDLMMQFIQMMDRVLSPAYCRPTVLFFANVLQPWQVKR